MNEAEVGRASFMVLSGPFRNVGDTVIRRRGIEWVLEAGCTAHVYVGAGRERWARDVVRDPRVVVHRSFRAWLRALWRAPARGRSLVLEPGEFSVDRRFARPVVVLTALAVLVRVTGGRVVQLPRALARSSRPGLWVHRVLVRSADVALWRDAATAETFGTGRLVPDIAFDDPRARPGDDDRPFLAVSLRGDREAPGEPWVGAVRTTAEALGLEVLVVVQVEADGEGATVLADRLGARVVPWDASTSSEDQEAVLRDVYRRSALTLSDRLHVVVLALNEGSSVARLAHGATDKVPRHLEAAGVAFPSFDPAASTDDEISGALREVVGDRATTRRQVDDARAEAERARRLVCDALSAAPAWTSRGSRPSVAARAPQGAE